MALPPLQRIVPLSLTSSVSVWPCPVRCSTNRSGEATSSPQPAIETHAAPAASAARQIRIQYAVISTIVPNQESGPRGAANMPPSSDAGDGPSDAAE